MAIIALKGMRFHAPHGVYAAEKVAGNAFRVDIWLEADIQAAAASDALEDAVDYAAARDVVAGVMEGPSLNLLETLVTRMGRGLLARFPQLRSVRVRLSKLSPPLPGEVACSAVEEQFFP